MTNPYKNYTSSPQELYFVQKGKEMARTGQEHGKIGRHHCSVLARNTLYKGHMKWRCTILTLISIYGMGDAPTFMIKGEAPYIRNGRRTCFHDKMRHNSSNAHLPLLT
jgi:hypothetical protein